MNKHFTKVYSGRKGCMCGCRGKWSYSSTHTGLYPGQEEDISDRSVKIISGKILRNTNHEVDLNAQCIYVEVGDRVLAAYWGV